MSPPTSSAPASASWQREASSARRRSLRPARHCRRNRRLHRLAIACGLSHPVEASQHRPPDWTGESIYVPEAGQRVHPSLLGLVGCDPQLPPPRQAVSRRCPFAESPWALGDYHRHRFVRRRWMLQIGLGACPGLAQRQHASWEAARPFTSPANRCQLRRCTGCRSVEMKGYKRTGNSYLHAEACQRHPTTSRSPATSFAWRSSPRPAFVVSVPWPADDHGLAARRPPPSGCSTGPTGRTLSLARIWARKA